MGDLAQKVREELRQSEIALAQAKSEVRDAKRAVERLKIKVETLGDILIGHVDDPTEEDHDQPGDFYAGKTTVQVIEEVLKEADRPLRIVDITMRAINNGYAGGPTRADNDRVFANFSSALSRDVKGSSSRFRKVDRGVFALSPYDALQATNDKTE